MDNNEEPIAVIGLASRFPGDADNAESFWRLMLEGRNVASDVPLQRFDAANFLSGSIRAFDSAFFNITPQDAKCTDPQQRLLLENVYHAFEDAGMILDEVSGSQTSVYVGGGINQEFVKVLGHDSEILGQTKAQGSGLSLLSGRISWFYNLRGSSLSIDTACSSSLVAVHMACEDLRNGRSAQAIAAGVGIMEHPDASIYLGDAGVLSPDGRSYSFDHRANGYGRGEGVGSVILKPLKTAIRDGNRIRAIIRATGSNQDGRTPGISMPSKEAQTRLMQDVYSTEGLDPQTATYVEAHGTVTATGDPIEIAAIANAFRTVDRDRSLIVGSVKASIGHLEGAAGIASMIKATLMVEKGILPRVADFDKITPRIPAEKWNISIGAKPSAWADQETRRVSINSYGIEGTNAVVVVDDSSSVLSSGQHGRLISNRPTTNGNAVNGHSTNGQLANGHSTITKERLQQRLLGSLF